MNPGLHCIKYAQETAEQETRRLIHAGAGEGGVMSQSLHWQAWPDLS
jgi:hypothetical protein